MSQKLNVRQLVATIGICLNLSAVQAQSQPADGTVAEPTEAQMRELMAGSGVMSSSRGFNLAATPSAGRFKRANAPTAEGLCSTKRVKSKTQVGQAARTLVVVPYVTDPAVPHLDLPINFSYASDQVLPGSRTLLDKLASILTEPDNQELNFAVAGHTDPSGSEQQNLKLSCARALAAVSYLVKQGVAPERLTAYGFGSSRPLSERMAASLRRVEVRRAN